MNLDECAQEPIHLPGTVQPHGVLLVLDEADLTILQASESCVHHLCCQVAALLGRPLDEVLGTEQTRQVRRLLATNPIMTVHPLGLELLRSGTTGPFDATLHRHDGLVLLELEPASPSRSSATAQLFSVRAAVLRIRDAATLDQASRIAAQQVAHLTGFERVMIYRFDQDWNGEVIAEVRGEDQEPYLGLRFPASDIPEQARRLYALNPRRIIVDVEYLPSPILPPRNPLTGRTPDLSYSILRSVSPLHLEYLRNMGVGATMSISILRDGALWGLIACHHRRPCHVPYPVRSACESLAETFSVQVGVTAAREHGHHRARLLRLCGELTLAMRKTDNFTGLRQAELLTLVEASGAAVYIRDRLFLLGGTPTEQQTRDLISWLYAWHSGDLLHIDCLSHPYPAAVEYKDLASGLLFVSLLPKSADCVLWFRPEQIQTVRWAGDPHHKPVIQGDPLLHPRRSFALWQERTALYSAPWLPWEVEAAQFLCRVILEQEARERRLIADRTHAQLQIALSQAQEGMRAKDEFLSTVSHELRTPLTSIRGSLGLLAAGHVGLIPAEAQQMLQIAVHNTDRLVRLINDILDIERIESGMVAMEKQLCQATDLMTGVSESLLALADLAGVALLVRPCGAVLWGDPDRIVQVLTNLVGNAIKFSPPRSTILLTGERRGDELVLSVMDQGRGIPADKLERIFGRFQQVDASDSREKGGTGLGLAICRTIATQHGGRLWVESVLGQGSTFFFALPLWLRDQIDLTAAPPAPLAVLAGGDDPRTGPLAGSVGPRRVLLVEDDLDLARVLTTVLERQGVAVALARTAQEAIRLLDRVIPDLLVLDVLVPSGGGFEVVAWLRQRTGYPRLPLVVYTVMDLDQPERQQLDLGGTLFLTKGRVSPDMLGQKVRAIIDDREARSAAVVDREARSAAVVDREARSAAVNR